MLIIPFVLQAQVSSNLWKLTYPNLVPSNSSWSTQVGNLTITGTCIGCNTGGTNADVNWAFFNGSGINLSTTTNSVLIGRTSTTTVSSLEVVGTTTSNNFIATSTANVSTFGYRVGIATSSPYASLSIQSGFATGDAFVVATSSGATVAGYDNDGHRFTSGPAPAISVCGTGSGSVIGDDQSGTITTATAATACTMTFSKAYRNTPTCTVTDNSLVGFADVASISVSAVTFGISSALTGGNLFYSCSYHK